MKKLLTVFVVVGMLFCGNIAQAFPWGHHGYYFRGGHWWLGDAIVEGLVVGTVIATLPPHCSTVYVGGIPYYFDGTYYYQGSPNGYVVVQPVEPMQNRPVTSYENVPVQSQPASPIHNTGSVTTIISNSDGTSTKVMLVKKGNGYVGPDGEFYESMPTMKQLKAVYGK
ncbi:MAG: hypothetical protein ABSH12_06100 [Endomicrobiales bacterium]|jgi:hypothetical protein